MFNYKNEITLNYKFNKSINIIYDKEDCKYYIINQSTKDALKTFFKLNYHNSIALIGPFGCGKSSLLLYINTLLSQTEEAKKCIDILRKYDKNLYNSYKSFINKKNFLKIKIIGEHNSFKDKFKEAILNNSILVKTSKYLIENNSYQMTKALELIKEDINLSSYTDILFSIDEFGKFIEYALEDDNTNDIFELQTLSEFVNKHLNFKLLVSLHKTFGEYNKYNLNINYSDWDKIQGRFESIVFKDDYYELLKILKESIFLKESKVIKKAQNLVYYICKNSIFNDKESIDFFKRIVPIHPFSAIVISEIFTRYFQNQRSIFSFLFSTEPYAFQSFIFEKRDKVELYSLSNLYNYVSYLLKVYNILLPDRELWYLAELRLKEYEIKKKLKKDIIKIVALIHTFKLSNIIKTDIEYISLSLIDKYNKNEIIEEINNLTNEGVLLFQEKTKSYSLIEETNIDINKELEKRILHNNLKFDNKLNKYILTKKVIAKRYFSEYGSIKKFEKVFIDKNKKLLNMPYKIILSSLKKEDLIKVSKNNKKSLFIPIKNKKKIEDLIKKIDALLDVKEEFKSTMSKDTKKIIENMLSDYFIETEKLINNISINNLLIYNGLEYLHTNQQVQNIISDIAEKFYPYAPKINNYTLNHTIMSKGSYTTHIKKLFEAMLNNSQKEYLGIEKYPAHKAIYLSVIKVARIHRKIDNKWQLSAPNSLNFEKVWKELDKIFSIKTNLDIVIQSLGEEPFGLNSFTAMFIISLYIIVNEERIHIIYNNTYKYFLTIDILMNMWKASKQYKLELINLTKDEEKLFKVYVEITTDLTEYSYSKDKVMSIIKVLYNKFSLLPQFAKNTQKISKEAINLRSALISMKDPKEAFFILFPRALGFNNIKELSVEEFKIKFKNAFNEIALVYKKELIDLEKFIAKIFYFENDFFPYGNGLIQISKKLTYVDGLDSEIKALLRSFNFSNNFTELINNISIILIKKKIEDCYDNDIEILKSKLKKYSEIILNKLDIADIVTDNKDVKKVSLVSLNESLSRVISIDKSKLDIINKDVLKFKKNMFKNYNREERLFLLYQLLNEELKNE